jgi:transposase-like protein
MHANARLTVRCRREMVALHEEGVSQAEVARQFRVSRATVSKWWRRYQADPTGQLVVSPHR